MDLNRRIASLMNDNSQLERRVDELSVSQRDSQSGPAVSVSGAKSSSEISVRPFWPTSEAFKESCNQAGSVVPCPYLIARTMSGL